MSLAWYTSHELLERDFPSPHEWSFRSRIAWHCAHVMQDIEASPNGVIEWGTVANAFDKLLLRLENEQIDGQGLTSIGRREAEPLHSNLLLDPAVAFDISSKPEPWRRGYFEALIGAARAAEKLDGLVMDMKSKKVWPVQYVVGPSNPKPKLLPPTREYEQPEENNCIRIAPLAGEYYKKILATRGLEEGQLIATELAYAEWLDYAGDHKSAEAHIRSALSRSLDATSNPSLIINIGTSVIKPNAPMLTQNILNSASSLAVHLASTGQPASALPIFLSVVRAYRSVPIRKPTKLPTLPFNPSADLWSLISSYAKGITSLVNFPPPPPTGNEIMASRPGDIDCAEAAATTYAAEVLFAIAPSRQETALTWTKEAVEAAHARSLAVDLEAQERFRCADCALVGLENWESMLIKMVTNSRSDTAKRMVGSWKEKDWKLEEQVYVQTQHRVESASVPAKIESGKQRLWKFMPTWVLLIF